MSDHLAELFNQQGLAGGAQPGLGIQHKWVAGATDSLGQVSQRVTDHD
jgi:hypothetical protein